MQMLHPHSGSIQEYMEQIDDPEVGRPSSCPQCPAKEPMTAHGFYRRTLVDEAFDDVIRIRRYLCQECCRTVSLSTLPFSVTTPWSVSTSISWPFTSLDTKYLP